MNVQERGTSSMSHDYERVTSSVSHEGLRERDKNTRAKEIKTHERERGGKSSSIYDTCDMSLMKHIRLIVTCHIYLTFCDLSYIFDFL